MEELIIEVGKQFLIIAVAIWILVAALYTIPRLEAYVKKELMALIIGVIVTVIGYLTGYFTGNLIALISTMIIAVSVSQSAYDKIKTVFNQYKNPL